MCTPSHEPLVASERTGQPGRGSQEVRAHHPRV